MNQIVKKVPDTTPVKVKHTAGATDAMNQIVKNLPETTPVNV